MKKFQMLLAVLGVSCTEKIDDVIIPDKKNEHKDPKSSWHQL